jgi:membrane fusion protein (multidrug efflux system)
MIKKAISGTAQPPATISTEIAKSEDWLPKLPAIGTLRAVQGVDVASEVDGIVRDINFDSGQRVAAGAVLVQLDDSVEQAELKSGLAELKKTQLELDRQKELLSRKNTSQTSYDNALASRDTAAAAVDRVRAVIAQKSIQAAFAGKLGIRKVDIGQYVASGTAMVTLQQLTPIYVDFPIPEQDLAKVDVGTKVEVAVDAEPGRTYEGEVESIDAKVDQATRNVLVRARLDNPETRLLPGMFANVNVVSGGPQKVVTLPRTAISYSLYGDSIYVVQDAPDGGAANAAGKKTQIVDRRFVRVGETRGDRVAVLEGVKPGEEVVTSGQIKLRPKAHVTVDNSQPLKPPAKRPLQ